MLLQLTNTTFERLNRLSSEQMREHRFHNIERGMPKSLMMKPYLEISHVSNFTYWLMTFVLFFLLDSNRHNPLCSLAIKILFLMAMSRNTQ